MRAAASAAKPSALVAQGVQRQDAAFFDLLEQRQDEVAGNAENFLRAVVLEGAAAQGRGSWGVSGGCKARMIVVARGAALIWIKRRTQINGRNAQLFMSLKQIVQFVC